MIDAETIQRLAAEQQTASHSVAREYCQHLFLSAFYRLRGTERVLFKGGTALRIVFGSPRLSEDLDFTGLGVRAKAIEDWIAETLASVERVGIRVGIEEAKTTSGGYLGFIRSRFLDYQVETQIEISLRERRAVRPETALIAGNFLPAYTLLHLPQDLLIEEKLRALLERGKPRDFYDLYFILRKGLLPQRCRELLAPALSKLRRTEPGSLKELKRFLPRDQQPILRDFHATLERELLRYGA